MKIALALLFAAALHAESICGKTYETADAYVVHIICIPSINSKPPLTQVFLRPKFGRAVDISLGDKAWICRVVDGWAGASFEGVFEELPKIEVLVVGRSE